MSATAGTITRRHLTSVGTTVEVTYAPVDETHVRIVGYRRSRTGAPPFRRVPDEEGRVVALATLPADVRPTPPAPPPAPVDPSRAMWRNDETHQAARLLGSDERTYAWTCRLDRIGLLTPATLRRHLPQRYPRLDLDWSRVDWSSLARTAATAVDPRYFA